MNPSTAQILEAVEACTADCGRSCCRTTRTSSPVARQVDALTEKHVAVVADHERARGARRARRLRPRRRARRRTTTTMTRRVERVRTGEVTQAVRDAVAECGPIARGRLDRARRATAIVAATATRRPTRCASCSASSSTTTARSSPCSSAPTRRPNETERIREHIELHVPARRGRVPRRRPAALPVPRRRGVAGRPGADRRPAAHAAGPPRDRPGAPEGRRRRARGAARRHGAAQRARPAPALPAPLGRPHEAGRHRRRSRSARRRRCSPRCSTIARPPHAPGPRARRGRRLRRHVAAQRHVLQPGVAREAARGRHRGRVLRQARRVPRQAPDDEPGRRRASAGRVSPTRRPA